MFQPDDFFLTLCRTFGELGAPDPQAICRTLLLRERRFVAHCYRCGGLMALWSPAAEEIVFLGPSRERLRSVPWPAIQRQAAA
jgi:hypothetical protein